MSMRKIFLQVAVCIIIFAASLGSHAQSLQDAVYLKDGSIIRGLVIEQVPNEYLKIKMKDGSVFVYKMLQVEKILKEPRRQGGKGLRKDAWEEGNLKSGYRGFVDLGYTVGVGEEGVGRASITTSHGLQIKKKYFVGVGVGVNYYNSEAVVDVPVFAHFRANFLDCWIAPYFDLKAGYAFIDSNGVYVNPSIGCRFSVGPKTGVNFGIGYTFQGNLYKNYYATEWNNCGGVDLKIGVDF